MAVIGAFTNFISIVLTFSNGAINTGVIKYTAEYSSDEKKIKLLFGTALRISILCSVLVGFILFMLADNFSKIIFSTEAYINPIRVLGITIILYSLNTLLISFLNGKGLINLYTLINTIGSIIGLILTMILVYLYKINGALYSIVLAQSVVFFITIFLIMKSSWFTWDYFKPIFDKKIALKLGNYSIMAIVSALTIPITQIILRNMITNKLGINEAGIWQGLLRISDGYLMLITTSLNTYYLPKLSTLKSNICLRKEIFDGYKLLIPILFFSCLLIYALRIFIINTLYSSAFVLMSPLFLWQLVGDFLKISAYLLAYLMLSKAMMKFYIITEVLFSLSYILISYFFIDLMGLKGITVAFALNYLLYLIVMIFAFRKLLFSKKANKT